MKHIATVLTMTMAGLIFAIDARAAEVKQVPAPNTCLVCQINKEISTFTPEVHQLNVDVVRLAFKSYACALKLGHAHKTRIFSIIDYSKPSTEKRMWVFDLKTGKVLYHVHVAHGKYTGLNMAKYFSDKMGSKKSSVGLFEAESPYVGNDGFSLNLKGLEPGFNDKADDRRIVIHGAWYVSPGFIKKNGYLGRSWGCPAINKDYSTPIINKIKNGSLIFAYYPEKEWLDNSKFLHCKLK